MLVLLPWGTPLVSPSVYLFTQSAYIIRICYFREEFMDEKTNTVTCIWCHRPWVAVLACEPFLGWPHNLWSSPCPSLSLSPKQYLLTGGLWPPPSWSSRSGSLTSSLLVNLVCRDSYKCMFVRASTPLVFTWLVSWVNRPEYRLISFTKIISWFTVITVRGLNFAVFSFYVFYCWFYLHPLDAYILEQEDRVVFSSVCG